MGGEGGEEEGLDVGVVVVDEGAEVGGGGDGGGRAGADGEGHFERWWGLVGGGRG